MSRPKDIIIIVGDILWIFMILFCSLSKTDAIT